MKILAVDDETLQLEKLEDAIYEAIPDAVVYSTRRPSDAIRIAAEQNFDIAFLDVQMRGMTGVQIAEKLKEKMPRLNIIFVTAFEQYKGQAMDLRASGFVTKPVTVEKILFELQNLRYPIEEAEKAVKTVVAESPKPSSEPALSESGKADNANNNTEVTNLNTNKPNVDEVSSADAGQIPDGETEKTESSSEASKLQDKTESSSKTSELQEKTKDMSEVVSDLLKSVGDESLADKLRELEARLANIGKQSEGTDNSLGRTTESQSDSQTSSDKETGDMKKLQELKRETNIQRDPIMAAGQRPLIYAQCFGNFDVFDQNHLPVAFDRSRAKEMLAYLISKRGSRCTNKEIAAVLFEDSDYSDVQDYYRHIAQSMVKAMKSVGAEAVIYKDSQSYAIDMRYLECDYYRFLQGDASAKLKYTGEFMSQYTWAEVVNGYVDSQI